MSEDAKGEVSDSATKTIQDGDVRAAILDLIGTDEDVMTSIVDSVSQVIVSKLLANESFIAKLADGLMKDGVIDEHNFVCYVHETVRCFVHHRLLGDVLYYRLGDSGFEDDDLGGAISEEMLQIWVRRLLANNSESVIYMDKVCDIVETVTCAECRAERSRKPSKRFLRGVRQASSVHFVCKPICLNRSSSGDSGWHRNRHKRDSQQTDMSFFDNGIGLDSDAGICDISSCDEDEDFFTAAGRKVDACVDNDVTRGQCKDDVCDVDITSGQFVQPLRVVIVPRRPRDYSRCRTRILQEPPCVGVKQRGKRSSSRSPPVSG